MLATSAAAFGQTSDCHPDVAPEKCTIDEAYEFYRGEQFAPPAEGLIAAGANVTVRKPEISAALENELPEMGRTDVLARLQKQMGDLDGLTWSASAALQTRRCDFARNADSRCYGRQPETYRHLLSVALSPLLSAGPDVDTSDVVLMLDSIATPEAAAGNLLDASLVTGTTNLAVARAQLRELAMRDVASVAANRTFFERANIERVAQLIDNQPQATLSAAYNALGRYGGPEGSTYTMELQFGNDYLNAIRRKCGSVACLQAEVDARLDNGVNTLKWVLSATYKRNNKWVVLDLGPEQVDGFDGFTLDANNEFSLKAQGGWKVGTEMGGENMRVDFSLEGQRVNVGEERKKNRWVAASTFTVPFGEQMSIPVTVTWANRSEFLPENAEKFGVHIGITYRIPNMPQMSLLGRR